jgi:hypothetical protein
MPDGAVIAFIFAVWIAGILVDGSIWIMYHLNHNMMSTSSVLRHRASSHSGCSVAHQPDEHGCQRATGLKFPTDQPTNGFGNRFTEQQISSAEV